MNEINCENVVKCYYIFKEREYIYYVMEFLAGGDLLGLLNAFILEFNVK